MAEWEELPASGWPDDETPETRQLRLATALVHALPDCRLELHGPDGDHMVVGCQADCELTPCELRLALIHSLRASGRSGRFAGVRVELRDAPPAVRHLGLGVYAFDGDCCFGHVVATWLGLRTVAEAVGRAVQDEDDPLASEPISFQADEHLRVTLLYTQRPASEAARRAVDDRLALRLASVCLTEELVAGLNPAAPGG